MCGLLCPLSGESLLCPKESEFMEKLISNKWKLCTLHTACTQSFQLVFHSLSIRLYTVYINSTGKQIFQLRLNNELFGAKYSEITRLEKVRFGETQFYWKASPWATVNYAVSRLSHMSVFFFGLTFAFLHSCKSLCLDWIWMDPIRNLKCMLLQDWMHILQFSSQNKIKNAIVQQG